METFRTNNKYVELFNSVTSSVTADIVLIYAHETTALPHFYQTVRTVSLGHCICKSRTVGYYMYHAAP